MSQITATVNAGPGGTLTFNETVAFPQGACTSQVVFTDDTVGGRRLLTATATGPGGARRTVRIQLNFLAEPFEYAAVANDGDFTIRGTGAVPGSGPGGADIVNGDIFIHGNVFVGTPGGGSQNPQINPFSTADDRPTVSITEDSGFLLLDNSTAYPQLSPPDANFFGYRPADQRPRPDVAGYVAALQGAVGVAPGNPTGNLTGTFGGSTVYNLKAIFDTLGTRSDGSLQQPSGCSCSGSPGGTCQLYCRLQPLGLKRNPGDRSQENADTPGDDYYFDGTRPGGELIPGKSGQRGAGRLVDLAVEGQPAVFLALDGNVRFHARDTYGFAIEGRGTIVATRDILISDNLIYRDGNSETDLARADLLGLVAQRDIWFGDPRYGTFYEGSGVMLAGRDFNFVFFQADGSCCKTPENAVTLNGTMLANRQIAMFRDWADPSSPTNSCPAGSSACRPAAFDPRDTSCGSPTGCWRFLTRAADGTVTFDTSTASFAECLTTPCASGTRRITHYQLTVNYETRLRQAPRVVPPGLPTGRGMIFAGSWRDWQECPPCN